MAIPLDHPCQAGSSQRQLCRPDLDAAGPSGQLGRIVEWFAVVAGGLGTLLVVLTWSRLFPEIRRLDRLLTTSRTVQLERESSAAEATAPPV